MDMVTIEAHQATEAVCFARFGILIDKCRKEMFRVVPVALFAGAAEIIAARAVDGGQRVHG